MNASDLYLKLTDPTEARAPVITHHRVWDAKLFMAAQRKLHTEKKEPADIRLASQATEAEYRKFMGYKEHAV